MSSKRVLVIEGKYKRKRTKKGDGRKIKISHEKRFKEKETREEDKKKNIKKKKWRRRDRRMRRRKRRRWRMRRRRSRRGKGKETSNSQLRDKNGRGWVAWQSDEENNDAVGYSEIDWRTWRNDPLKRVVCRDHRDTIDIAHSSTRIVGSSSTRQCRIPKYNICTYVLSTLLSARRTLSLSLLTIYDVRGVRLVSYLETSSTICGSLLTINQNNLFDYDDLSLCPPNGTYFPSFLRVVFLLQSN